ncbi:hypothetical protein U9M48_012678 [Paspalum notatum var. saurae]|uniref:Uncharacterized protein n=1 Tax=Paspalum notatum var. saurae TaxID=547442 RepID=A0AAQ3T0M4_PASNO
MGIQLNTLELRWARPCRPPLRYGAGSASFHGARPPILLLAACLPPLARDRPWEGEWPPQRSPPCWPLSPPLPPPPRSATEASNPCATPSSLLFSGLRGGLIQHAATSFRPSNFYPAATTTRQADVRRQGDGPDAERRGAKSGRLIGRPHILRETGARLLIVLWWPADSMKSRFLNIGYMFAPVIGT